VAQSGHDISATTNAFVRSRISVDVKEKATAVLQEMGLSVSGVARIVLTRVARENALPADFKPNKLTRETMRETGARDQPALWSRLLKPARVVQLLLRVGIGQELAHTRIELV
jgi:DNA-damage-inducible protein J